MFCTKCGKEISNEAKFCGHCGAPVLSRQAVEEPAAPVEEPKAAAPVIEEPKAAEPVIEEPVEVENEVEMAEEVKTEAIFEEPAVEPVAVPAEEPLDPPAPAAEPESPFAAPVSQPKAKKKISPWLWVAVGVGALLIAAVVLIIVLLGRLSDNEANRILDEPTAQPGSYGSQEPTEPFEEEPEEPAENETPVFTDFPVLSHYYDDFIESDTFDDSTPLGDGEILYMGEAFFDDIGECHVSFVLSKDRKNLKNFIIYLTDLSLVLEKDGRTYDLSNITSIRNNYNSMNEYTEDYCEIALGESKLMEFYLDTLNYDYAYGALDFSFKYYPPMSAGSASNPVDAYLGVSDVYFEPVMIG